MALPHPLADELIADRFRALSEPMRIRLLGRLRDGEASVGELAAAVGTSGQNLSKHLGALQREGLVARRKQGSFAYYSIADETAFALCEAVCASLERQLESRWRFVASVRELS